jgi:hypothetical protein
MDECMNYVYVVTDSRTQVTRQRDYEDEWDRDDTYTSWSVNGVLLSKGDRWDTGEVPVDFDVKPGDTVYLLYAIYSTGIR